MSSDLGAGLRHQGGSDASRTHLGRISDRSSPSPNGGARLSVRLAVTAHGGALHVGRHPVDSRPAPPDDNRLLLAPPAAIRVAFALTALSRRKEGAIPLEDHVTPLVPVPARVLHEREVLTDLLDSGAPYRFDEEPSPSTMHSRLYSEPSGYRAVTVHVEAACLHTAGARSMTSSTHEHLIG
eukprot:CAMPEP_0183350340 /NCGR_PEP_ID=MMETSP0164_2-20130417/18440_1 /TAXON_ID=221442 /ORGANISM="Coccolithus pelagicus ssp braarudi, Strain PLY182g" /LENGTH=181 /DNA_ID=CAMNT_0025522239 /DNA_START=174 /DNA_END=720 /DNA_ORIENTATION=+